MLSAKQFLEWYLGVPASGPGEGTAWRFEWRSLGPEGWPGWLVVALCVTVVALVVALSLYESRRLSWPRRGSLLALRLGTLALLAVMLSQLTLAVDRTGLPVVALLIDDSASMNLIEETGKGSSAGNSTRLDQVRELLGRDDARFLSKLSRRFRVRIYRFDRNAELLVHDDAWKPPGLPPEIDSLTADGAGTRPASAVRRVLDELRGTSPSAIIVFTDGISTMGERDALTSVAELAARRGVPLYPVGVGRGGPARDLELFELVSDEFGFWGDPVRVAVRFRAFGVASEPVTMTLIDSSTHTELARTTLPAAGDGKTSLAELTFVPDRAGVIEFEARAAMAIEEPNRRNNSQSGRVEIRKEKLRVLLADHAPRFEFRFLKSLLEREPTIDLDTVLQEADLGYARQDETGLDRFPLQASRIMEYDVIIFGDLDPSLLGNDVLTALANFVRKKGGGLIGIAGPRFFPMEYAGTPLQDVLPVDPSDVTLPAPGELLTRALRPQLTLQAERSGPMFRFDADPAESERIWNSLPGFYWHASPGTLQPGAVPLATVARPGGRTEPIILLQRFGAGRTLLHLTDETWRWRFRVGDAYFGRYWVQSIRYLSSLGGTSSAEEGGGITLSTGRANYSQGEAVLLRARVREGRAIEGNVLQAIVEDDSGSRRELPLTRLGELSSVFEGRLERLPQGNYHAWIRTPTVSGSPPAADFEVTAPQRELAVQTPNLADLRRAAEQSGGRYFSLEEAAGLPNRLPAGHPVRLEAASPLPLWSRPEMLIAIVMLLGGEWWLRKRGRLA